MLFRILFTLLFFSGCFVPLGASAASIPSGGANQRASVEGCVGETLFNGLWRVKVLSSKLDTNPGDPDYKNWGVVIELRNGKNAQNSPADSGFQDYPQLVFADDTILDMQTMAQVQYQNDVFYKSVPPGGAAHTTLWYRLGDENAQHTPTKLLVAIKPVDNGKKFGYSVANPSFRIKLDCNAQTG